jgi:hypothetical protein
VVEDLCSVVEILCSVAEVLCSVVKALSVAEALSSRVGSFMFSGNN